MKRIKITLDCLISDNDADNLIQTINGNKHEIEWLFEDHFPVDSKIVSLKVDEGDSKISEITFL